MNEVPEPIPEEIIFNKQPVSISNLRRVIKLSAVLLFLVIVSLIVGLYFLSKEMQAGPNFPTYQTIVVESGTSVKSIAESLKAQNVVQSSLLLYFTIILFHEPTDIKASSYSFEEPLSTFQVAKRLTEGDFDTNLVRLTHFEGERVSLLAKRAGVELINFHEATFIDIAEQYEGRLFPDTYFIPPTFTSEELLNLMLETFDKKISVYNEQIQQNSLTLDEILVLASIIEREGNTDESKKMIAGIFLNRLEIGMPLQADASIEYVLDKPLEELTPEDLKIDSPYNTYLNLELPPTPIGNPGLVAIEAVLFPTPSNYFFYITGNDGEFYYAKTYQEHLRNIESYLR